MKVNDNMKLWNAVKKTNPNYTKEVGYGRKFTSIDAQYQIEQATEQFGVYGRDWGIKRIKYDVLPLHDNEIMALATATFFIPNGEFQISSSINIVSAKGKSDNEFAKKMETDITTKALSKMGFNADVFMGKFDDNKYVNQLREEFKKPTPKKDIDSKVLEAMSGAVEAGKGQAVLKRMGEFNDSMNKEMILKLINKLELEEVKNEGS